MELGPHLVLALLESAVSTAVLALTAIGLALVFGIMRVVNVAHGEFFMIGALIAPSARSSPRSDCSTSFNKCR